MVDEKELIKKMMNLAESTTKKPVNDLYSAILHRISRSHSQDVTIEYFETLDDLRLVKSAIQILLENNNDLNNEKKTTGKTLLEKINSKAGSFISSKPIIDHGQSKYTFRDGSNSRFEDLEKVENMLIKTDLFNKITELSDICSDGLAFLGIQQPEFWHRDDGIEEIDLTEEKKDGRKQSKPTDTQ